MKSHLEQLKKAVDFIEENLRGPLDISDISKVAGQSPWHFQRTFRAVTGDSVYRYVVGRRMSIAAKLLVSSDLAIIDLALDLQFENQEPKRRSSIDIHY